MAAPERKRVRWRYIGARAGAKSQLVYVWLDEAGHEHAFSKIKGGVVGGTYEVEVTADGSSVFRNPPPRYIEREDNDSTLVYELEDRRARTQAEAERAEKAIEPELDQALKVIRAYYWKQIGAARRAAVLASVIQRITG